MEILAILAIIFAFLAGGGLVGLIMYVRELQQRIKALEEANRENLPFKSRIAAENATAALLSEIVQNRMKGEALDTALTWLQVLRNPKASKGD